MEIIQANPEMPLIRQRPGKHTLPTWSVYIFLVGFVGSAVEAILYYSGLQTKQLAGSLLAIALSLTIIACAAGNFSVLALRDERSRGFSNYWIDLPDSFNLAFLFFSTILLAIGTHLTTGRKSILIDVTLGTGLSFLYLCQIASVASLRRLYPKLALGFLIGLCYSIAVMTGRGALNIAGLSMHLAIFAMTGFVLGFLSNSIHAEMLKKSTFANLMSARARLWSEIAQKAHQIAEMENSGDIENAVIDAAVALGYPVSAIAVLAKDMSTFRYLHPTAAIPRELIDRDLPLSGISSMVLSSRNTQILDYQSLDNAIPLIKAIELRTTIGIPMWNAGEIVAVLIAGSLSDREIFAEELTALELLAAAGSSALEHRSITSSLIAQLTRYSSMIEDSPNPMIVIDENKTIVLANKRMDLLLGYPRKQLTSMNLNDFLADPEPIYTLLSQDVPANSSAEFQSFATSSDQNRLEVEVSAAKGRPNSDRDVVAITFRDITKQRRTEARLLDLANFDPATGLATRARLLDELRKAVLRNARTKGAVVLILFELENFEPVSHAGSGHDREHILLAILRDLEDYIRDGDLLAKVSENRFAILAEDLSESRTLSYVRQLLTFTTETRYVDEVAVRADATFGIAFAGPAISAETLLQQANSALLKALTNHESQIAFYSLEQRVAAQRRLQMEDDLRRALREQQFHLEYQPIVNLQTGQIVAAEALIRWDPAGNHSVAPDAFIPVAEETGIIIPIGTWVIREAVRQMALWRKDRSLFADFSMHLNVSRVQLQSDEILRDITLALEDFQIPSDKLSVEITETALLNDSQTANQIIHKLSELGVKIAIDDFGTGYSSLSMLTTLPIDLVKIDKSFVGQLGATSDLTVEAIVNMANRLNLAIVAEGIESAEQAEKLQRFGCYYGQGFLFSRSVRPEQFPSLQFD